jgi:transposase, IS5 family
VDNFNTFILHEEYTRVENLGDTLSNISKSINWEAFRSIVSQIYKDNSETGGRPHWDEILMIKGILSKP